MIVQRWKFKDVASTAEAVLPINPNEMSSPYYGKNITSYGTGVLWGTERLRAFQAPPQILEVTWSGVILAKDHYDLLLAWQIARKTVRVTDHLERTFDVIIKSFDPVERLPTARHDWRANYTMTVLLLEEPQ